MWKHFINELLHEPRKWKNNARIKGILLNKSEHKILHENIQHFKYAVYTYTHIHIYTWHNYFINYVSSFTYLIRKGRSILCHAGINNIYLKGLVTPFPSICNKILTWMMNWYTYLSRIFLPMKIRTIVYIYSNI